MGFAGVVALGNLKQADSKAMRQSLIAISSFRAQLKANSWNKHESDAVWKSMNGSKKQSDQNIDIALAIDLGETEFSSIVTAGGGSYIGVLKEIPHKMESVILFNSPHTRTTLGIPISRLIVEAVRERLAESDAAFAEAGAK